MEIIAFISNSDRLLLRLTSRRFRNLIKPIPVIVHTMRATDAIYCMHECLYTNHDLYIIDMFKIATIMHCNICESEIKILQASIATDRECIKHLIKYNIGKKTKLIKLLGDPSNETHVCRPLVILNKQIREILMKNCKVMW